MYLFGAIFLGILLSIFTKMSLLKAILFWTLALVLVMKKGDKKLFLFPIIIFAVYINFNFRDYKIEDFSGEVIGKVISSKEDRSILKTSSISGKKLNTKILVYEKLEGGANYKIFGKFSSPLPAMNYGTFDFEKNNKSQGIYAIGNIKSCKKISEPSVFYRLSNFCIDRAKKFYSENLDERNSNLMSSIVLADKSLIEEGDRDRFNNLGISHILAVSGLHIGVLAIFLESITKKITKNRKITDFVVTMALLFYIITIGFPISALRAFLFFLLYKGNIYLKKDLDVKKIYFLSLSIILFINPMAIYSISMIMSYGAIFGLVFVYPALNSKMAGSGIIKKSILGTASVLISLFPIINYYFDGFSILVFIVNLVIVPIYSAIISLGFILGVGILPRLLGNILNILMNATYGLESLFISRGSFFTTIRAFKFEYIFAYYILLILILYRHKLKEIIVPNIKVIEIYIVVFFVVTSLGILEDYHTYKECHLYIGQGDSTLISFRDKNYLIDTGGARYENKIAEKFLFPTLKVRGISKIDGIFLSHFDEDHAGNLNKLVKKYNVKNVYINHLPKDPKILEDAKKFSKVIMLKKGDIIKISKDTKIEVISDVLNSEDENDNSMVLLIDHRGFKTLFTGDISEKVEKEINSKIDILKVAHHGSKTSTSSEFLDNTKPKIAIISAGVNNSYGHPHQEVIQNLEKHDIIYYITAKDGEVDLKMQSDKIKIDTKKEEVDLKFYILLIILNTTLLYIVARENYELQTNLQRRNT
ncbi:DNA internalization-related competence protein ComEC/Rec2 [Peptoniphilus sp. AGMB00490]|uniref:DNA internalization-related competence protein ComEC/Rec2 n=1 Tax=Peptoniphilus faecalis TaxID=2731255 RepID=A0A848RCV2_9FIRM|nr:DNA internalization-related competence protein ComEC/Rec2 [Peptoniphilus faecalis]NMW84660.1 DNA internalization-related competence protein ComEC/Rec2 [Peptoniphilus faecalis]